MIYIQSHQIIDKLQVQPLADITDMLDSYVAGQLAMEDQDKTEQQIRDAFWQQWRQSADCSKRELYLALDETTLPDATNALDTITAWIEHPDTPRAVKIEWETSYRYARRSPLISAFAPQFGLTDEQVDDILKLAQSKAI